MSVIRIICVDSSGSTQSQKRYWTSVNSLVSQIGFFNHILHWSTVCREIDDVNKIMPHGGTSPSVFLDYIINVLKLIEGEKNRAKIELYVTTDGCIYEDDVIECVNFLNILGPYLAFVNVYYVGYEESMNFGLNAVFGNVTRLQYSVNDVDNVRSVLTLDELKASIDGGDIFGDNFIPSLVSRVQYMKAVLRKGSDEAMVRQLCDMRQKVIELLDSETKTRDTAVVRECYESNDGRRLERELKHMLFLEDSAERMRLRTQILSCFDRASQLRLEDIRSRIIARCHDLDSVAKSATDANMTKSATDANVATETESTSNVEDSITLDNIDPSCVCLLMQTAHEPVLDPNSSYVRNPVSVLECETLCDNIFKRFEMHTLSFETVLQLRSSGSGGNREFQSAFTRTTCRAFVLDACDWPRINLNSFAISRLFKNNKQDGKYIYGSKLLWNFVLLYLLRRQIDRLGGADGAGEAVSWNRESVVETLEEALRKFYYNETFLYPLTLHVKIALPLKKGLPLYIVLWYVNRVAPFYAENSSRNVLRLPGTRILFELYKKYGRREAFDTEATMNVLENKLNLYRLWNAMVDRRCDPELKFVVRASYQNYVVIEDKIVLLSGPLRGSPPPLVAGFRPAEVMYLFRKLTANSSRHEELLPRNADSGDLSEPVAVVLNEASDQEQPSEFPFHMDIDLKTCRPSEICRVTKRPAKECAPTDQYDVRSGSYAKVFNLYCSKKKKYPENASQLVLIHNRRRAKDNISTRHIEKYMDHIFQIHEDVMKTYSCVEYLKICDPDRK